MIDGFETTPAQPHPDATIRAAACMSECWQSTAEVLSIVF